MNLICCPHAGGGKIFYSKWMRSFNKEIEFHVMSYPKRDELVRMRMPSSIQKLAELIFLRNRELFEDDYAIWGHSMGSFWHGGSRQDNARARPRGRSSPRRPPWHRTPGAKRPRTGSWTRTAPCQWTLG